MAANRKLAKNSIFVTGSVGVGGVLLFFIMIVIARYLGVEEYGHFSIVLTIVSIVQLFADGGIVNITIRDIATQKSKLCEYVGSTTLGLLVISLICLGLTAGYTSIASGTYDQSVTLLLMMAAAFCAMHGLVFGAAIRAMEDMHITAAFAIAQKVLLLAAVFIVIALDLGVVGVAAAHLIVNVIQLFGLWFTVSKKYGRVIFSLNWAHWWETQKQALPLGGAMVLRKITVHLDIILLTLLATLVAVGLYSSAYRILQMVEVAVIAFSSVLFPALSRYAVNDKDQFIRLCNDAMALLFGVAIPVAVWFCLSAKNVVLIFFGEEYFDAYKVLQVLGIALICLMPAALFNPAFAALHKQKMLMAIAAFSLVVNALVDLALIPHFSYLGAAIGTAVTEFAVFVAGAIVLARIGIPIEISLRVGKTIVATACACASYLLLPEGLGLLLEVFRTTIFFAVFIGVAVVLKLIEPRKVMAMIRAPQQTNGAADA